MTTVRRASSDRGEVLLRRRPEDRVLELRVNGIFVMDTLETAAEQALARTALAEIDAARRGLTVLVGGLGLGFTMAEVLGDRRVERVVVVEIEPDLVAWHAEGLIEPTRDAFADPRTQVLVDDVRHAISEPKAAGLDLILLDVDNGPGYLVYDANAAVYEHPFLASCQAALTAGGVLAIWVASPAPELSARLTDVFGCCDELVVPVTLGSRDTSYHVLVARR